MSPLHVRTIYCADTNGPFTETHFLKDCLPYDKQEIEEEIGRG